MFPLQGTKKYLLGKVRASSRLERDDAVVVVTVDDDDDGVACVRGVT